MPQPKCSRWWLVLALCLYAAGFAVAAVWDYPLTAALYSPNNLLAITMEAFGWYPAFVPALLLLALPAAQGRPTSATRRTGFGILLFAGAAALYFVSYRYLVNRLAPGAAGTAAYGVLPFAAAALTVFLFFRFGRLPAGTYQRLRFFAAWGSIFLVASLLIVTLLKWMWARTRFDDMLALASPHLFTPWYRPFGNGGSSFPSGHTAYAAGIFSLLLLCRLFPFFAAHRRWVCGLCWGYTAGMALARLAMGRHFLSDTLAASGVVVLLFLLMCHTSFYKKSLARCLAATPPPPMGSVGSTPDKETETPHAI